MATTSSQSLHDNDTTTSLAALWTRFRIADEVRFKDNRRAKTILLSLAAESLPHELYIRTYLLLTSTTSDLNEEEEYLNFATRMWEASRAAYALDSLENETICELSSDLSDTRDVLRVFRRQEEMDAVIEEERRRASEIPSRQLPSSSRATAPSMTSTTPSSRFPGTVQESLNMTQTFAFIQPARVTVDGREVEGYVDGRPEIVGRISRRITDDDLSHKRVDAYGTILNDNGVPIAYAVRTHHFGFQLR